ncbi:MAG: hypothetical protein ACEQSB_00240 [Undibacterium sp.]
MNIERKSADVIALRSRKPLAETVIIEKAIEEEIVKDEDLSHREVADNFKKLIDSGRLKGVIAIGKDTKTGYFYTDMAFPMPGRAGGCSPQEAYAYAGLFEALKMEFTEIASMAPCLMPDGSIIDPSVELTDDDYEDEQ